MYVHLHPGRRAEILGERGDQLDQNLNATARRTDDDNVAMCHAVDARKF